MGPLGSYLLMDDSRCKRCTGVATIASLFRRLTVVNGPVLGRHIYNLDNNFLIQIKIF